MDEHITNTPTSAALRVNLVLLTVSRPPYRRDAAGLCNNLASRTAGVFATFLGPPKLATRRAHACIANRIAIRERCVGPGAVRARAQAPLCGNSLRMLKNFLPQR
jgi:hypothetical protein